MTDFFRATEITAENIEMAKDGGVSARDQAAEIEIGCVTWGTIYGSQRGQMTVWPNGRGAVMWGGDSLWGDWDADRRLLFCDDLCGDPVMVDEAGEVLRPDDSAANACHSNGTVD